MKKFLAVIAALCCFMATSAMATIYSPTQSELLSYSMLGSDNTQVMATAPYDDGVGGAEFSVIFAPFSDHFGWAFLGKEYSGLDLSSYDSFKLTIRNDNENPWNFELAIGSSSGWVQSAYSSIVNQTSRTLSLDLSSLSDDFLSNVTTVGFYVFEDVPIREASGRLDYNPEFAASTVPEPGTMMLLGAGFLGLAIYGKRRRNI